MGSITITGAQIGRQQRTLDRRESDEDNEYRHAFLIIEARRGPGGSSSRHVLCAESDSERDSWVEELVRYVTGAYNEDQVAVIHNGPNPVPISSGVQNASAQPRTSSSSASDVATTPTRRTCEAGKGTTTPLSKLTTDVGNPKLFPVASGHADEVSKSSPVKSVLSPVDPMSLEGPMSSSLPTTSLLLGEDMDVTTSVRANSEMGHYSDLVDQRAANGRLGHISPDQSRKKTRRMSVNPLKGPIPERTPSPDKEAALPTPRVDAHGKVKISGPMNGIPIPAGYKFGGKDAPSDPSVSANDRREKAKSRTFWPPFGRHGNLTFPLRHSP